VQLVLARIVMMKIMDIVQQKLELVYVMVNIKVIIVMNVLITIVHQMDQLVLLSVVLVV
jgi:hypothetical protein